MNRFKLIARRTMLGLAALLLIAAPLPAFADGSSVVCPQVYGITAPTGASAATFTYNKDTCLWENDYYTWDPVTKLYTPKFDQPYTYNNATGLYDAPTWIYNAADGKYKAATISVAHPPAGATVIGGPPPPSNTISNTGDGSSNNINNNGAGGTNSINNTGSGSSNGINNNGSGSANLTNADGVSVNNILGSTASSGNAIVLANTNGGDATSGNAQGTANVVNLLQSSASLQGNVATFTANIYGDVQGDLLLDPSQLPPSGAPDPNNLTINNSANTSINNNIDVNANSGDATVAQNTNAGNATSGAASAIVNIVNVINSIITSGQSFVGTINIYGNFDGDILLPQDTLNKVLADNFPTVNATVGADGSVNVINNTGADSSNGINNNNPGSTNVNNTNNTGINNNVDLKAASGDATVSQNTNAGNATTGTASTNLVLLNLTGQNIICGDALLVFVNVLGNWVGMIVNAPTGTTAAALGGGNCSVGANGTNTNINNTSNATINNDVKANANSGDATVSQNTKAGNANSGDAKVAANIANVSNSSLNFGSWFGILFINVFGTWHGSFGINTAAGNKPGASSTAGGSTNPVKGVKVFQFVPSTGNTHTAVLAAAATPGNNTISNTGSGSHNTIVAGATTDKPSGPAAPQTHRSSLIWTAGSLFFLAGVLSFEELFSKRKQAAGAARRYIDSLIVHPLKRD